MRRYESEIFSQGNLNSFGMRRYETKFISQGKGILYTHPACFGMRRYASKIFTQGNLNKANLGVHIP